MAAADPATLALYAVGLASIAITWWALRPLAGQMGASAVSTTSAFALAFEHYPSIPLALAATAIALRFRRPDLRLPRWSLAQRVLVLALGWATYEMFRIAGEGSRAAAESNAGLVIRFERTLGLFAERDIQASLTSSPLVTDIMNGAYSHGFLPVVVAASLWLAVAEPGRFRLLAVSLGISGLLASATFILFPVAPPRLVADSGLVDTVVANGGQHNFANEYAAIPSLHVGWIGLVAAVVAMRTTRVQRSVLVAVPTLLMGGVVVGTGNHFVVDGLVGTAYALVPLFLIERAPSLRPLAARLAPAWRNPLVSAGPGSSLRTHFALTTLGPLLAYLVVRQGVDPGFTDFWGYLVFQLAATLALLLAGERLFGAVGGLSWQTYVLVVVCSYADTLGTDGDLYRELATYDKLTHFLGVAAITSAAYDCLKAMGRRGSLAMAPGRAVLIAVAVGLVAGAGWELYEWAADAILATKRVQSPGDTAWDLVSDTFGALAVPLALRVTGRLRPASAAPPERLRSHGELRP